MDKIIYEFYYNVGRYDFDNCYRCVVDKETEKMFYGDLFYKSGIPYNRRFAINKRNLNRVHQSSNNDGLFYRVQVESDDIKDAERKACKIIYDYITEFINEFKSVIES